MSGIAAQPEAPAKPQPSSHLDLDAIDPSQLSQDAQFGGPAGNWVRYLGRAGWHAIDGLAQPGAADALLFGSIVTAKHYYSEKTWPAVLNDINGLGRDALRSATHAPETFAKMTPAERSKASAELVFNAFFFLGAKTPIETEAAEQLGLKYLSPEQLKNLGIERCDLPKLKLERDEFSVKAWLPGDSHAFVVAAVENPGVVSVTSINRGALRGGLGGDLLADTLRQHGIVPTKELRFTSIRNQPTIDTFKQGGDPASSVLGQLGTRALRSLGKTPKCYKFEMVKGKLNLVIDLE